MIPPILCYHEIDTRFELGVTRLGPRVFRRQMQSLAAHGYMAVGATALVEPARRATPRSVVLTFDDGYAALADHAFPVLAGLGLTALVFIVTDYVGRENRWDVRYGGRWFRHLDWDQLAAWQERGIEVHAHGATHRRLTWLSSDEAADELGRAREAIASRLGGAGGGRAPLGICYPFGAVDERIRALAVQAGYRLGFAGARAAGTDVLMLRREPVYAWDVFAPPLVLREGAAGAAARATARLAGRFAVVTSAIKQQRAG
jgi:peptidoglycan/xylan/chitin deacetylase (PgdA/CDA1 family)